MNLNDCTQCCFASHWYRQWHLLGCLPSIEFYCTDDMHGTSSKRKLRNIANCDMFFCFKFAHYSRESHLLFLKKPDKNANKTWMRPKINVQDDWNVRGFIDSCCIYPNIQEKVMHLLFLKKRLEELLALPKVIPWVVEKPIIQLLQKAAKNYSWIFGPGLGVSMFLLT